MMTASEHSNNLHQMASKVNKALRLLCANRSPNKLHRASKGAKTERHAKYN